MAMKVVGSKHKAIVKFQILHQVPFDRLVLCSRKLMQFLRELPYHQSPLVKISTTPA